MIKHVLLVGLLLSIVACTTERVIEPTDTKRASELNAQLGLGYLKQGQFKRALSKLNKALKYNDENADAHHYMAELHRRLGEMDKADQHYQQALELTPNNSTIKNNYGVYLCGEGEYDKAISQFRSVLKDPLYKAKANVHENIGLCKYRQGKLAVAEAAFKQALSLSASLPKSLIKMAQLTYDRGDNKKAYDYFSRYLTLSTHTAESAWLGLLLENERGAKNAVSSYKVLLKGKFPESKQAKLLKKLEAQGKI